jgi:hypothetical protein
MSKSLSKASEFSKKLDAIFPNLGSNTINESSKRILLGNGNHKYKGVAIKSIEDIMCESDVLDSKGGITGKVSPEKVTEFYNLICEYCPNLETDIREIFRKTKLQVPDNPVLDYVQNIVDSLTILQEDQEIKKNYGEEIDKHIRTFTDIKEEKKIYPELLLLKNWMEEKEKEVNKPIMTKVCNLVKNVCKLVGAYISGDLKEVKKCKKQINLIMTSITSKSKITDKFKKTRENMVGLEQKSHVERSRESNSSDVRSPGL